MSLSDSGNAARRFFQNGEPDLPPGQLGPGSPDALRGRASRYAPHRYAPHDGAALDAELAAAFSKDDPVLRPPGPEVSRAHRLTADPFERFNPDNLPENTAAPEIAALAGGVIAPRSTGAANTERTQAVAQSEIGYQQAGGKDPDDRTAAVSGQDGAVAIWALHAQLKRLRKERPQAFAAARAVSGVGLDDLIETFSAEKCEAVLAAFDGILGAETSTNGSAAFRHLDTLGALI